MFHCCSSCLADKTKHTLSSSSIKTYPHYSVMRLWRRPRLQMHPQMHACMCSRDVLYVDMSMNAQVHIRERICKCICICIRSRTRSQICSRLHISVALPAHTVVSYYSPRQATNGGGEQLAVTAVPRLERQVGQCAALAVETWLVHAVSIKQQLQKPTTERMLLADLYTELWCGVICHFWETDRLISSRAARNRKSDWQLFGKLHPERSSKTLYNTTMMVLDQW